MSECCNLYVLYMLKLYVKNFEGLLLKLTDSRLVRKLFLEGSTSAENIFCFHTSLSTTKLKELRLSKLPFQLLKANWRNWRLLEGVELRIDNYTLDFLCYKIKYNFFFSQLLGLFSLCDQYHSILRRIGPVHNIWIFAWLWTCRGTYWCMCVSAFTRRQKF